LSELFQKDMIQLLKAQLNKKDSGILQMEEKLAEVKQEKEILQKDLGE
jgi:hypothetical protein